MEYPEFLPENGTIGFVAPSFGCATAPYRQAFLHALERFRGMGYQTVLGENCFKGEGIGISSTPEACGAELNDAYCSGEADVLISCGGGELMCEVLPHMDFGRMKRAKPKWYMGYSDNTNFTFLSATYLDVAAIYGPGAAAFGMEPWHEALTDALDVLSGKTDTVHGYRLWERSQAKDEEHPLAPYNVTEPVIIRSFVPAEGSGGAELKEAADGRELLMEGRLIGGCMDCLVNLLGTSFDHVAEFHARYAGEKFIWFLEACDLNIMSIRRALWQMKHAGWFAGVSAFFIGRPLCFGEEAFGIDQYRAVTDVLGEFGVPVIMDMDIGHLPPMMPLITGAYARASVRGNDVRLTYIWK